MRRALLGIGLGSAAYGFAPGSAQSELYALCNLVKLPLLTFVSRRSVRSATVSPRARSALRAPLTLREVRVS